MSYKIVQNTIIEAFTDECIREVSDRSNIDYSIHASEIFTACPRRYVIAYQSKLPPRITGINANSPHIGLTFKLGLAIEQILVTALRRTGGLYGRWVCDRCGNEFVGVLTDECSCGGEYKYHQLVLKSHHGVISISGSMDAIFNVNGTNYIVECKSIGDRRVYYDMVEPIIEHTYSVSAYLYLASLHPEHNIDPNVAFIAYVPKVMSSNVIKVFQVTNDSVAYSTVVKFSRWISAWYSDMKIPQRLCSSSRSYLCVKNCPVEVARICWA